MNQVGLVGRFTRDPVLKKISETRVQTSFVIAINRNFRNSQGNVDADFVPCVAWGRLAERISNHCCKGSLVGISGRLQSRSYTNRENLKVYVLELVVDDVRFYVLKARGQTNVTENGDSIEDNFDVTKDFVLPEIEEAIPVP